MGSAERCADRRSVRKDGHPPDEAWTKRSFWWHFVEMVIVMLLYMAIFGAAVSGVFALLGHGNLLHYAALRAALMSA
jgi:hypothetical protein